MFACAWRSGHLERRARHRACPLPPQAEWRARLDDGSDTTSTALFMEGRVLDLDGTPVPDAIVDVWHANAIGFYSYFGPPQSAFNLRRRS